MGKTVVKQGDVDDLWDKLHQTKSPVTVDDFNTAVQEVFGVTDEPEDPAFLTPLEFADDPDEAANAEEADTIAAENSSPSM